MTSVLAQDHRDAPLLLGDHLEEAGLEGQREQRFSLLTLPLSS